MLAMDWVLAGAERQHGRAFNGIVRKHFGMTGEVHEASRGSLAGAILGLGMVLVALFIGLVVAVNLPGSWLGAVWALLLAGIGGGLIAKHIINVRRAETANKQATKRQNAF